MMSQERPQPPAPSVWLRGLTRDLVDRGRLGELLAAGAVQGVIADPEILAAALASGKAYTAPLRPLAQAGWPPEQALDALRVDDARAAADLLLPLYERTNGDAGFVSLGLRPASLREPDLALEEARWFWAAVNRPNLLVTIPVAGSTLSILERAVSEGINVHAAGLFSLERYAEVYEAYIRGLEARRVRGDMLEHVAAVASFSLSRLDDHLDRRLTELVLRGGAIGERAESLLGRSGAALAKLAHAQFRAEIAVERFHALAEKGARPQRLIWSLASAGNVGPGGAARLAGLSGAETIFSLPVEALPLGGVPSGFEGGIERDLSAARGTLEALETLGVSLSAVSDFLENERLARLSSAFDTMDETVRGTHKSLRQELAGLAPAVPEVVARLDAEAVSRRLWRGDPALWAGPDRKPDEVSDRLGWLNLPQASEVAVRDLQDFALELRRSGYRHAVLLGMGGSALAPDVFRRILDRGQGLSLHVLDSTDPAAVLEVTRAVPPIEALYIVASKSGSTIEPLSLFEHFWAEAGEQLGGDAPSHFVAVTDPGTSLEKLARERRFRRVFLAPPDVGGRFSALSIFGLLPAALVGVDLEGLLRGGARMARLCGAKAETGRNPGAFLGALLASAALSGRGNLTLVADPDLLPLADWIEQLVAESSGKDGRGILPIVGEPVGGARSYGRDRFVAYLRREGSLDVRVETWIRAGTPVAILDCAEGAPGLGAEVFRWEFATAVACHSLGVNAFDQPDVQRAKSRTGDLLKAYARKGSLAPPPTLWEAPGIRLYGDRERPAPPSTSNIEALGTWLLDQIDPGKGIAFLVYLHSEPALQRRLGALRKELRDRLHLATTLGFGPRYLHSTGQIHKGGPDRQVFLVITAGPEVDVPIPGAGYSFGVLERAQALGDLQALLDLGRRAFGIHLDTPGKIRDFTQGLHAAARLREPSARPRAARRSRKPE